MPKHGFLTPKAIGNRIKAKGLCKLRWYCEMCVKQCRDENGFKCHQTSEGHLRQMRIFAENPEAVMKQYSEDFEKEFLDVLSRRHGTKRVRASLVYNEFIAHKTHTHMNSTQWETLTSFVLYLGKMGKAVADETEKGWYIQWVDRDPRLLAMQEAAARREKTDLDDVEKQARAIEKQMQAAKARDEDRGQTAEAGPTELRREEGQSALRIGLNARATTFVPGGGGSGSSLTTAGGSLAATNGHSGGGGGGGGSNALLKRPRLSGAFGGAEEGGVAGNAGGLKNNGKGKGAGKRSMMEVMMDQERAKKKAKKEAEEEKAAAAAAAAAEAKARAKASKGGDGGGGESGRKDYWLRPGVIVKVMNKKVGGGKYYKKKARLRKVVERYVGEVKMLDSGDRLRVDQDDLETVIPAVGGEVLIVNGRCRGERAALLSLDTEAFAASVRVTSDGPDLGAVLDKVEYEDICKAVPVEEA
ncbi:unnamed protein product [Pylaiella littoralis]